MADPTGPRRCRVCTDPLNPGAKLGLCLDCWLLERANDKEGAYAPDLEQLIIRLMDGRTVQDQDDDGEDFFLGDINGRRLDGFDSFQLPPGHGG